MSYLRSSYISVESYVASDLLINMYNLLDSKLYEGRDCAPYSCSPLCSQCAPSTRHKLVLNEYLLTKGRKKENSYTSESRNMEEEKKMSRVQIFTKRITRGHSCKAKTSSPNLNSNSSKSYPYTQFSSN